MLGRQRLLRAAIQTPPCGCTMSVTGTPRQLGTCRQSLPSTRLRRKPQLVVVSAHRKMGVPRSHPAVRRAPDSESLQMNRNAHKIIRWVRFCIVSGCQLHGTEVVPGLANAPVSELLDTQTLFDPFGHRITPPSALSVAGCSGATVRVHVVEVCAASLDFCRPGQPNLFLETGEALCADFRRGKLLIQ